MDSHRTTDNLGIEPEERTTPRARRAGTRPRTPQPRLQATEATEEALRTTERRLTRLVLDLHDGPLQDVLALGLDLRLFREQLTRHTDGDQEAPRLLGRVDDLEARLLVLATDLREIASTAQWPTFLARPFADAVAAEVQSFEQHAGASAIVELDGEFDELTASQRIALLRVLEEALSNIRQHSGAGNVTISMRQDRKRVYAEIVDDGCGFDLENALVRAARVGRLGIVGMAERVRLLGGKFDIDTRLGGPTRIALILDR
jgi:signal transduction histidine kinase